MGTEADKPGLQALEAFYAGSTENVGDLRDLVQAVSISVTRVFSLAPLTQADAVAISKKLLSGRVIPIDTDAIAALIVKKQFPVRPGKDGNMLTIESIGELSALESELCVRAVGLGAWVVENTSLTAPDGEHLPLSSVLALCGLSRGIAILTSMLQLAEASNYVAVGILQRSLTELTIYVTYLLRDGESAITALVGAHKWQFRDLAEDPYLAHIDLDSDNIAPRRANFRAILDHLHSLGPGPAWLPGEYYRSLFGTASHIFTHTSLVGLLQHIATDDTGRQWLTLTERDSGIEGSQSERAFVGAVSVASLLLQLAPHLESEVFDDLITRFRDFALEVVDAKASSFSPRGQESYREAMEHPDIRATWGLEPIHDESDLPPQGD
jgi:hypothetical protein